ncbi:MAG: response regulator [Sphaerochaetaceae bacterium]|nr:response regulator [Sphaerochaetaceae bacterium]
MQYYLTNEEKKYFSQLPMPISIAQVVKDEIRYLHVSLGFCKLFNIEETEALKYLNSSIDENLLVYDRDREKLEAFSKQIIMKPKISHEITFRARKSLDNNYFYLNCVSSYLVKDKSFFIYFTYTKISHSLIRTISSKKNVQAQQVSIAEDSLNAVAVIAKKNFKLLYLNKAAKNLFPHDEGAIDKITCFKFFRNTNHPCNNCPIVVSNIADNVFELDCEYYNKKVQVHLVETIWDGEEAYIEYIRDITSEKRNERLFNLYKALIAYKQNLNVEVGALYGFDLETELVVFYFLSSEKADHEGKHFSKVISDFYNNIVGEEDKKNFLEFFDIKRFKQNYLDNKSDSIEYHQNIKGKIVTLRANYNFIEDPTTKHMLLVINVYDVTERLEMEKMLNAIVSEQNEFIMRQDSNTKTCVVLASDNNFIRFPAGYSSYTYKEYDEYIHSHINLIDTYGQKRITSCEEGARKIKSSSYSVTYIIEIDNKIYHKRALSFRAKDRSLYTVVYDVTDLATKEIVRNEKLERINKKLVKAQREAAVANSAKSDFLSRMSHDMRTPLGAILSLAEFGLEDNNPTKFSEYFNQIKENADYLLSLVNDLLDFQKIESHTIDIENSIIEFGTTAKAIERIVRLRANEKNITFSYSGKNEIQEKFLIFDEKRFKQILVNLLNNAIKYTPIGGKVSWNLLVKKNKKGEIIAYHTISDNGVGMSKSFQKHMFEPFSKEANCLSEIEGGTGLGLVITKNIVEALGGTITCESELHKGTTFYVNLPLKVPNKDQVLEYKKYKNNEYSESKLINKKILVCEDVSINQIIIKKLLEEKQAIVTIANNGLEGVNLAKENNYDAILMDIRMPILDGTQATEKIREFNKTVPIIALSANAFAHDVERSIYVGMNAHLAKPINKDELYSTLSDLL